MEYTIKRNQVSPAYLDEFREHYNKIEYEPAISYKNNSRYSKLRTYYDDVKNRRIHETWNQTVIQNTSQDQYFTVTKTEENRLDIISNYFYYTGKYWWVVAMANYILDPFDVPVGMYLRIPPISALYGEGGVFDG